ncbi:hypothetical protein DFH09DRAFT_1315823 [Mycena vulgaris]|nr:hypothetical protein DFH09DRAFT_1315823 [Mycena vulgaris]
MWDRVHYIPPPSLEKLLHPSKLKDLTVYAPPDLHAAKSFRSWAELYLPAKAHCINLAYVTYAADRPSHVLAFMCGEIPHIKVVMFIRVDVPEKWPENELIKEDKKVYPNFSTAWVGFSDQLLGEWVAKMEGRPSVLEHPPPHAIPREHIFDSPT